MPELPEVEVTCRGIAPHLVGRTIVSVAVRHTRLRWPVPEELGDVLPGQTIRSVSRRAKYVQIATDSGTLWIHLGMSGSLRVLTRPGPPARHDHFDLVCEGSTLRFNDPRRFGAILWQPAGSDLHALPGHLAALGCEPLDPEWSGAAFWQATRSRSGSIKSVLLAGDVVVGVGNIYASESLFRAGIHPVRPARRISRERYDRLVEAIRAVLREAIAQGGSTLRDFVNSAGAPGYFQLAHRVYGRSDLPCPQCGQPVRRLVQQQRATWYCARCQR